ncbi:redoxin domain-containing protein [Spirosoma areae]
MSTRPKLIVSPLHQLPVIDTAIVVNRHARFTINIPEPCPAYIWIEGNKDDVNFLLDSPQIDIAFDPYATVQTVISGSLSSDLWLQQRSVLNQLIESQTELRVEFRETINLTDSLSVYEQAADSLHMVYQNTVVKLIDENPLSASSWHLFASNFSSLPYATTLTLFDKLSSFSSYPSYKKIREHLSYKQVGGSAIDFTLPTLSENLVTLSKLKNKYILIDFSNTFMASCQRRHRALRELYKTYHPLGLEIITISHEFEKQSGKAALTKENLPWVVVLDVAGTSKITEAYKVDRVPDNLLIDAHKTVIGRDMSIEELTSRLQDRLK